MERRLCAVLYAAIILYQVHILESTCPPLDSLSFGTIIRLPDGGVPSAETYQTDETLQYRCSVNYILVDASSNISVSSSNTTCMTTGVWSLTGVSCVELECIDPPPIANGFGLPSSPPYTVGSEVVYNCSAGYQIQWPDSEQGQETIFCQKNAQWNRIPTCKKSSGGLSLVTGLVIAVAIFAFLFIVSLGVIIICTSWAFYLRRQLTRGDMAEDEVAYTKSHGAFTLNNPIVTATTKDDESAGNPLYLTPDEMNEFESKKRQLGSTG